MKRLTPAQERFAVEVAKGLTQAEAFRTAKPHAARWKPETVWSKASAMAALPAVQARIEGLRARVSARLDVSVERVLQERARLAFFDPRKLLDEHGHPLPIQQLDDDTAAAIAGLELETDHTYVGRGRTRRIAVTTRTAKFKLADKGASLTALERHLGMYADDANKGGFVLNIQINLGG